MNSVKAIRVRMGMSASALARASGVSRQAIQHIERGGGMQASTLMAIATALEVSPAELLQEDPGLFAAEAARESLVAP